MFRIARLGNRSTLLTSTPLAATGICASAAGNARNPRHDGGMRITKFGHACVRIESDGQVLVIDPGSFTDREAVDGATGVLITHEHADHFDADNLGATG